jgi:glycosyltransferase involved in cell wall biosynthesis
MAKILVYCQDVIGKSMAGPGIRYWEFATALAKEHEVTLACPNVPDVSSDTFKLVSYEHKRVPQIVKGFDVIITQLVSPAMGYMARKHNTKIIVDAYDPVLLEALEIWHHESPKQQRNVNKRYWAEMSISLLFADALICASEKQRDLWVGAMMALDRIRPADYAKDVSLRSFIDVVPFGLRDHNPKSNGTGFREQRGIKKSDKVLLWAGGIYEWYDTLTLIRAMEIVSRKRQDIKLAFLGLKHPNAGVLESSLTGRTKKLSDDLGLTDKTVIFNFGWIPYGDWPSYLLETDIGLSNHFDHLETRFSFRTRVIDSYVWGLRPIITTKGDAMADLVLKERIGRVVDYEDPEDLAQAIVELADNHNEYHGIQQRMEALREQYRWSKVVQPINVMTARLVKQPARGYTWGEVKLMFRMYLYILKQVREDKGVWYVFTNVLSKFYRITFQRT